MATTTSGAEPPITNRLLDVLPPRDRARVLDGCREVDLSFGQALANPGDRIRHVYFPTAGFVSILVPMGASQILEVALAGNEGLLGLPVALGVPFSPVRAMVQGDGNAWRMDAASFRRDLRDLPRLGACVGRYTHAVMSQLHRAAGCNRFHLVEQRVARWLLMTADRAHAATFHMTHEFLAFMLGVRRVGVTEAAGALQDRGLISYSRGRMTILDRPGLEAASCACYRADLDSYDEAFRERAFTRRLPRAGLPARRSSRARAANGGER